MGFPKIGCAAVLLGAFLGACGGGEQQAENAAPVAGAGKSQVVVTGETVTLDASASFDGDGDTLTYQWTLISKPDGSSTGVSGSDTQKPVFVADSPGSYTFGLAVSDGKASSTNAATVTVVTYGSAGYTKLDEHGQPLLDSAASWSCVLDKAGKLVWEVKTKDGSSRDWRRLYTNYDSVKQPQLDGVNFPTTAQIDAVTNTVGYQGAVNSAGLCGGKDWRLPTQRELSGLLTQSSAPYVDGIYFPDVDLSAGSSSEWFWSSTSAGEATAQVVSFKTYSPVYFMWFDFRSAAHSLRLVRSVQ
ncbi:DUF1566 domain-containing protein [Uliginosibacterium sp. TH139]|uniref:Lcl C-terminal domain-containing protein n=1 Tax=Uliginosibacterium sp. TH139 TaxID=2067453 RepID=UPI000C7A666C|nr:DUF1566 domain-containing protein [Uliginosibacterium sp. TH139]PLK49398.1 hypothetical protein C0V76_09430 [Uliginosibacterium sp. TH139]